MPYWTRKFCLLRARPYAESEILLLGKQSRINSA